MAKHNQIGMESWFKWLWTRRGCKQTRQAGLSILQTADVLGFFMRSHLWGLQKNKIAGTVLWVRIINKCLLIAERLAQVSQVDHLNSVCWPLRGSRRRLGGLGFTSVSSEQETDNYCPDWWFMSSAETGGVANWHKRQYAMHQSICDSVVQDAADGAMMWGRFCLFSHNILSSVDDHVPLWSQWTHLSDCSFLNVNA